ncbi:MAG: DNA internalization-related competence protein ComEC/Rec2, partial [Peptococcaceae bacterium]|nr:DNA internalization-related competence protein ComEC/Rec2 [Peptococcaceae bacterium]
MVSRPLVYITLTFALGLLIADNLTISSDFYFAGSLIMACITLIAYFIDSRGIFLFLLGVFLFSGAAFGASEKNRQLSFQDRFLGKDAIIEGYLCKEPEYRPGKTVYKIQVEKIIQEGEAHITKAKVLVYISGQQKSLWYGDEVRFSGTPYRPISPGNPGQFSYAEYLGDKGIWALISIDSPESFIKTGSAKGHFLVKTALDLKQRLSQVNRSTMEASQGAIVNGVVFGQRGEIDPETMEIFSEIGIVHILSVSGLNIGLIVAGSLGLLKLLNIQRGVFSLTSLTILFYTYITGIEIAVFRASVMAWLYLLAKKIGRDNDWPTTLSGAALIILAFNPEAIFNPGFQLSFGATWGILLLGPVIDEALKKTGLNNGYLRGSLWVSMGAQLGTLPLIVYHYNLFSPVSLLANLLAVPLAGLILPLGLAASLTGLLSIKIALIINSANAALLDFLMLIAKFIHYIPGGFFYIQAPPPAIFFAYYFCLVIVAIDTENWNRSSPVWLKRTAGALLPMLMLVMICNFNWQGQEDLEVHVIDVGQGDSIFIVFPNGRNMLIDTGGWKEEYKKGRGAGESVLAYLRRLGINKLDALVLSHPHEDHCAGAIYLAPRLEIKSVLVSPSRGFFDSKETVDPGYNRIISDFVRKQVPVQELFAGDLINMDPVVEIRVLAPRTNLITGTRSDVNNNSLVLSLRYKASSFLFTGDIEKESQSMLLENYKSLEHRVMKVPHHGSRHTLEEFLQEVDPELSVISVGKNLFGQ